ncbi:MAG: PAAR domain-containing protein [Chloracidobacterium sp.]|nr:PAAR domain-containing protein [Chloracidobacterium sp.]
MPEAARIEDQVEHTPAVAALLAGAVAGALIGAAIVLTGGAAAPAIAAVAVAACTGASLGGGLGELLGSLLPGIKTGPIIAPCANSVFINGRKAARAAGEEGKGGDYVDCSGQPFIPFSSHPHRVIAEGSATVFIEGFPAARKGDRVSCGSKIAVGSVNVFVWGGTRQYTEIDSEVPWYADAILLGLGLIGGVGAIALAGKGLRVLFACKFAGALAGGWGGGVTGHWLGGKLFGEGSKGQKIMAFSAGLIGGGLGARLASSNPFYNPFQRWAARNNFPGLQSGNNCSVQSSQQLIRAATGKNISEADMEQLAQGTGVYDPKYGTKSGGSATILRSAGVPAHLEENNPQNIQNALSEGKGVVSSHDAGELWGDPQNVGDGHAVNTTGIVRDADGNVTHYITNDTGTGEAARVVPAQQYERSLRPGNRLTVTDGPIW